MTPKDIQIIRSTFRRVHRDKSAGLVFYERLFATAPETRRLFKGEIAEQGRKLMETLNVAVATLRDPESLVALLQRLGRSHATYGVEPRYYDSVGAALLWTLERSLGGDFTAEVRAAWTTLYGTVAKVMRDAAGAAAATGGPSEPRPA